MVLILLFPIVFTAVSLYLFLVIFGGGVLSWILALVFSILGSFFLLKGHLKTYWNDFKNTFNSYKKLLVLTPIFFFVLMFTLVISPLVITKKTDGFEHIQVTLGDYYKHSFVVTMLKQDGIPPKNPYFPTTYLSYYYGYYLIPAAFSKIFFVQPHLAFYLFTIFAYSVGLMCIFKIITDKIKGFWFQFLTSLMLVTASGVDVFSQIIEEYQPLHQFINPSILSSGQIFALINSYKSFVYVPQHFFTSLVLVIFIYILLDQKLVQKLNEYKKIIIFSVFIVYIFLSSTFVAITLVFWLGLLFLFIKSLRRSLIHSFFLAGVLLIPYILYLSNRPNLFYQYDFKPFQIVNMQNGDLNFIINTLLTFTIKYGLIFLLLPIIIASKGIKFIIKNLLFIIAITVPFIITWFIRTPNYNDFSMRTSISIQIALPIVFIWLVQNLKNNIVKIFLILIVVFVISAGSLGWYLEYSRHWRNRLILHPKDSEYLLTIRKLPEEIKLASLDNERWVELTPSLGFKKILSPHLFDSYVFFIGDKEDKHTRFENLAKKIFLEENLATDSSMLVLDKNTHLESLSQFLEMFPSDKLVLQNQLWVKKDVNPWLAIFKEMGIKIDPLTSHFSLVDYQDLVYKSKSHRIYINSQEPQYIEIKDYKFPLEKGFWYLATCKTTPGKEKITLELEDYYLVFSKELDDTNRCQGKLFYLQNSEEVRVMHSSNIKDVIVFPVVIKKIRE